MKKMKSRSFRILMAAVISAAMLCPQVKVSAADGLVSKAATSYFPSKTVMKKTARKTEPEEWNQKEIKAYKFGTLEDALYYALTGGIKYYDQNYFKNPDLIKLTPVESGALGLAVVGDNKQEAILYDSNKKMIKKLPLSYVKAQVNAGETYYIEFPKNCKEGLITAYVLQNECGGLAKNDLNMQKGEEICGRKKMALKTLFFRKGIHFIKGKEYKDGSGLLQVTVQVQPLLGTKKTELVRKCLNTYYKRNFYRNMETTWLRPGENRISFIEENGFHVVFGQRCCNKKGEDVCGDTFSFTNFGRKRAVMLLSDGMGTGKKANEDSRRLIETLEDLLEAGISEEFALEMIQDALLFQDKGAFSTIDAAVISLKTGILKLLKAGGMATFIRHKNSVERIMPAALPPGCRIGQQFDLKYKKLYDGDMVIMVSDGMLEFENMPEISFRMESLIGKIKTNNAQVFANELIEAVPVLEDGYDDDRTVLVAAIWEKGTQKCGINIGRE